jgi:hypothetical protein
VRRIQAKLAKRCPDPVAFFACFYFAAMCPGEAVYLNIRQCHLPEEGWGRLDLTTAATRAGRAWTDTGEAHDVRGLKHRATGDDIRPVPIPPELVRYLRGHLDQFGTTPDGRLVRGTRGGGYLSESTYGPFWKAARRAGHSVEVLLRVYAKCIDGQQEAMNRRIEQTLEADKCDDSACEEEIDSVNQSGEM